MTIPASSIVKVNPGVVNAGGEGLVLNGLFLTENILMPTGVVLSFAPGPSGNLGQNVAAFFGISSAEAAAAVIYFQGFANATLTPSAMLFAAYNLAARAAFLKSGSFANITLTQLQATMGASVTASVGATFTGNASGSNLTTTAVTGYISPGDTISGTGVPVGTTILSQTSGTAGGAGVYVTSVVTTASSATVTSFGTVLNVTAVGSGTLNPGNSITGTGITANTTILAQLSGTTGGIGQYSLNLATAAYVASGTIAGGGILVLTLDGVVKTSTLINLSAASSFSNAASLISTAFSSGPTITWSAVTSTFLYQSTTTGTTSTLTFGTGNGSSSLLTTSATGALLSQGAVVDTPSSAMNNAIAESQNWASMVTLWEPNLATKELFAAWFNAADDAYLWLAWDSDAQASVQGASEPFGVVALGLEYQGVACIGGDPAAVPGGTTLTAMVMNVAIFVAGAIASINFQSTNGRTTLAFLQQSGLLPTCANSQTAANLLANGYSFYGAYATRNQNFVFFYNGNMPGAFDWIDTYIDDIWMNDQFQVTLMELLTAIGSAAYNASGYGAIRAALVNGPIAAALNFGAIRTGIELSSTQVQEVNQQAGQSVDTIISTQGYYLQILDPGATARQERTSPLIRFYYTDGGSIQMITISSLDIL